MINIKYIIKGGGFRGNQGSPEINIKYNINIIIKGGGFRGNLGSPE